MSLFSMTGFGKGEASSAEYIVTVEIKSVNHRFKDLRFKMPSLFNSLEILLRQKINDNFKRGSFDIYINYKKNEEAEKVSDLDFDKINFFLKNFEKNLTLNNNQFSINPSDFLRTEFQKDQDDDFKNELKKLASNAFDLSIGDLLQSRKSEGKKLAKVIEGHIELYSKFFKIIRDLAPGFQQEVEERLYKKINDVKKELLIDEPRFLQEVVYYMDKMDIQEEIDRINAHLNKLSQLLSSGGEVGRKVDFFVQELNRETNTIGSKSSDTSISESVVNMKSQLEKIREQGLNIE